MGFIKALPPPSMWKHPIRRFRDKVRFVYGRKSNTNYIRLWPNPGFMFTLGKTVVEYSRKRGYKKKTLR